MRVQDARGSTYVVLSVYMPAVVARDDLAAILDDQSGIIYNLEDDTVICGDFNGDMGQVGGFRGAGVTTQAGKFVAEFLTKHSMVAVNLLELAKGPVHTFESHIGSSCIDYILIPEFMVDAILSCNVFGDNGLNTSDHFPIVTSLCMDKLPCKIESKGKNKRIKWDKWDKVRMHNEYQIPLTRMLEELNEEIEMSPCDPLSIDTFFNELITILHKAAEVLPRNKYVKHLKPIWDEELSTLKKEKMKHFKIWRDKGRSREKDDPFRVNMCTAKNIFSKRQTD